MPTGMRRDIAIGREQGQLRRALGFFVEGFDDAAPGLTLVVVDLAQIQHRPLHHLAAGAALALDDAPIAMVLAVLEPSSGAQEHDRRSHYTLLSQHKRQLVFTTRTWRVNGLDISRLFDPHCPRNRRFGPPVEKVGLRPLMQTLTRSIKRLCHLCYLDRYRKRTPRGPFPQRLPAALPGLRASAGKWCRTRNVILRSHAV